MGNVAWVRGALACLVVLTGCHRDRGAVADPVPPADANGAETDHALAAAWDAHFDSDAPLASADRAAAEQRILDALAKVDEVTAQQPVECKARSCRIVLRSESAAKLEQGLGALIGAPGPTMAAKPPIDGWVVISRRATASDGAITATIYTGQGTIPQL